MRVILGIVVAAIVIGLIVLVIYLVKVKRNNNDDEEAEKYSDELLDLIDQPKTYDKLIEISYSNSGGSNGYLDQYTLNVTQKKLVREYKAYRNDPSHNTEYSVTDADIEVLMSDIDEYNFPEWKGLRINQEYTSLDASTAHIGFVYDNSSKGKNSREEYGISFDMDIPEDGRDALREFRNYITSLERPQNLIKEYDEPDQIVHTPMLDALNQQ